MTAAQKKLLNSDKQFTNFTHSQKSRQTCIPFWQDIAVRHEACMKTETVALTKWLSGIPKITYSDNKKTQPKPKTDLPYTTDLTQTSHQRCTIICQKSKGRLKISIARRVICIKFHTETNFKRHRTKLRRHGDLTHGMCASLHHEAKMKRILRS